jgi:RNA polymerase sigma factor (sigma-70 family)
LLLVRYSIYMHAKQYTLLVTEYATRLFQYIKKQGVLAHDAEDIMQNCFEALWKSKVKDNTEAGKYLFGVAHHQVADYWRRGNKIVYKHELPNSISTHNQADNHQQYLHKLLLNLAEQERSLILLKDYQGYSYAEIATICQLNESQVKVYLHRARLKMQQMIGNLQQVI